MVVVQGQFTRLIQDELLSLQREVLGMPDDAQYPGEEYVEEARMPLEKPSIGEYMGVLNSKRYGPRQANVAQAIGAGYQEADFIQGMIEGVKQESATHGIYTILHRLANDNAELKRHVENLHRQLAKEKETVYEILEAFARKLDETED